jgi:hypothetical protein
VISIEGEYSQVRLDKNLAIEKEGSGITLALQNNRTLLPMVSAQSLALP